MNARLHRLWLPFAGLVLIALAGCSVIPEPQTDPTRYYVLTGPGMSASDLQAHTGRLKLGLKSVQLAPYLDKSCVVVRHGENQLVYNDYMRWAEPLAAGITRVLRAQLLASPEVDRVFTHPFPFDQARDYDIGINVVRCEGVQEDGRSLVRFAVMLEITTTGDNARVIKRKVFTAPDRTWNGRDYGALVQTLSDDVNALSAEVVAALPTK